MIPSVSSNVRRYLRFDDGLPLCRAYLGRSKFVGVRLTASRSRVRSTRLHLPTPIGEHVLVRTVTASVDDRTGVQV